MKRSDELKQERTELVNAQSELVETSKKEKRDFSAEEETEFDTRDAEIKELDKKIERALKMEETQKRAAQAAAAVDSVIEQPEKKENKQFSLLRALNTLASGKQLTGVEAEVHERAKAEMKAQGLPLEEGLRIALPIQQRAQTVGDDAGAKGGALVASTPQFVYPLQPNLPIESLGVNVMSNLVGDVPLPTSGTFTFSYTGETDAVSATDVAIAGPTLSPKRCSGVVDISRKLLLQSSFNVEQYIIGLINQAYGNAITTAAISGAGGDAPTGLYDLITTNINTTAGVPTYATVLDLESLVDAADGTNVARGYLSDTKLRAIIKGTKLDSGSGLFLSDGKELNGYKYEASTLVGTLDAGASHPLIFGDWSQLHVGYWGQMSILVDPYTQAASGKVRLIVDGYSDTACTNQKAFAINKVMTLS